MFSQSLCELEWKGGLQSSSLIIGMALPCVTFRNIMSFIRVVVGWRVDLRMTFELCAVGCYRID
uniref:Uncharacterized protein n=1 Tax=Physcomitrium patens TaxID=3218 RepID=A0A2K1KBM8_PHYPA|nr:hypothetical protein PHYPA_010371 [Physcomitrium patens]